MWSNRTDWNFSRESLPQLATLFRQQASEELMHAQKIAD